MGDNLTDTLTGENTETHEIETNVSPEEYLTTLVGDGKKFHTDEDLAKAYIHADRHIRELVDDLKTERARSAEIGELLAELRNMKQTNVKPDDDDDNERFDPEYISKVVDERLIAKQAQEAAKRNVEMTKNKLVEFYGSQEAVTEALKGMSQTFKDSLNFAAQRDPEAAMRMLTGATASDKTRVPSNTPGTETRQNPPASNVNLGLTWSQACEVRRKDPKKYNSPEFRQKLTNEIAKAMAAGIDFYST